MIQVEKQKSVQRAKWIEIDTIAIVERSILRAMLRHNSYFVRLKDLDLEDVEKNEEMRRVVRDVLANYIAIENVEDHQESIVTLPEIWGMLTEDEKKMLLFLLTYDHIAGDPTDIVTKYIDKKTAKCLENRIPIRDVVLPYLKKYFDVKKDDSEYDKRNQIGIVRYYVYDERGKPIGIITRTVEYCNTCFNNDAKTLIAEKCVQWDM